MPECVLEQGKIYYIAYGDNTCIVGRYDRSDCTKHFFYSILHYWNGYETFRHTDQYCVHSGITELRRATKPEKHSLVQKEIENDII